MVDLLFVRIFGNVYTIVGRHGSCSASSTKLSTVGVFAVGQDEQRVVLHGSARTGDVKVQ